MSFMRGFNYYGFCLLFLLFLNLFFVQGVYADLTTGFTEDQTTTGSGSLTQSGSSTTSKKYTGPSTGSGESYTGGSGSGTNKNTDDKTINIGPPSPPSSQPEASGTHTITIVGGKPPIKGSECTPKKGVIFTKKFSLLLENNDGLDLNSEENKKLILQEIKKVNGDPFFVDFRACKYPKGWSCPDGCILKVGIRTRIMAVHQGLLPSSEKDLCEVLDNNDKEMGKSVLESGIFKMDIKFKEHIGDPPKDTASEEYTKWLEDASKLMVPKLMPEISKRVNEFRDKYKCPEGCTPDVNIIPDWDSLIKDIQWFKGKAHIELPYKIIFICVKIQPNQIEESSEWRLSGEIIGEKLCKEKFLGIFG